MEIMKVFSSYDDYGYEDERLYSVLLSEEELALFSEVKDDLAAAGLGAGAAVGLGAGAYGAGKAAGVISNKAKINRRLAHGDAIEASNKARKEFMVNRGLAMGNKNNEKALKESEKKLDKIYRKINKLSKEGNIEKGSRVASEKLAAAQNWVKAHPGKSSAIAAGALAAGAGLGYGAKKLKDHKKGE